MDDEEAVRRCQLGDREAFRHLVERYKNVLYGTAYLMTGNHSIAEEQVQEAFLSAWRGIKGFRTGQPPKPWLVRILVNGIVSKRRLQRVLTTPLEEMAHQAASDTTEALAERAEDQQRVHQALAALSPDHRQVVMLRYLTGLSVMEVAQVLGCRQGTVKSRQHRALQLLRERMAE